LVTYLVISTHIAFLITSKEIVDSVLIQKLICFLVRNVMYALITKYVPFMHCVFNL
jgi:hypothetical protein